MTEEVKAPSPAGSTPDYNLSTLLGHRLAYANAGIRTALADAKRKKAVLKGWQRDSTTDPERIRWEHSRDWRVMESADGILAPTGETYNRLVLDVDDPGDLPRLEEAIGVRLRGVTREVGTPSGGYQLHYLWPGDGGRSIRNSVGKQVRDDFEGLDVRGEGGLAMMPPSRGYSFANDLPTAAPQPELVAWMRGRSKQRSAATSPRRNGAQPSSLDGTIPDGARNATLFYEVAKPAKDNGLGHDAVLGLALEANRTRCQPPLEDAEVEKIVDSAMSWRPVRGAASEEAREAVGRMMALRRVWGWRGTGGQSDRDVLRVLLEGALRYGARNPDGSVDFSMSVRSVALLASVSYVTVSRSSTRRLEEAGWVAKIPGEGPRDAATWRLSLPARGANTRHGRGGGASVLAVLAPPDETPTWRFRGLLGKGAGFVEELLEAHGPMAVEEIAEALGSRPRDVRRSYLRDDRGERFNTLEARGLAEELDDGRWALVEGHAEKVAEIKAAKYSVLLRRERFETDPLTGVREYQQAVYGRSLSEDEREENDRQTYDRHREDFRAELIRRELERRDDEDETTIAATPDLLAASKAGRMLMCNGWRREGSRVWANLTTGEARSIDSAMEELRKELV